MYFRDMVGSCKYVVICTCDLEGCPCIYTTYEKNKEGRFRRITPVPVNLSVIEDMEKFITYVDSAYNGVYGYDWEYVNDVLIILTSVRKSTAIKPRSNEFQYPEKINEKFVE
jgi:hypothetical protein